MLVEIYTRSVNFGYRNVLLGILLRTLTMNPIRQCFRTTIKFLGYHLLSSGSKVPCSVGKAGALNNLKLVNSFQVRRWCYEMQKSSISTAC